MTPRQVYREPNFSGRWRPQDDDDSVATADAIREAEGEVLRRIFILLRDRVLLDAHAKTRPPPHIAARLIVLMTLLAPGLTPSLAAEGRLLGVSRAWLSKLSVTFQRDLGLPHLPRTNGNTSSIRLDRTNRKWTLAHTNAAVRSALLADCAAETSRADNSSQSL